METKLTLISKITAENKKKRLINLMYLLNVPTLTECFYMLKRDKAPGIDNITFKEYEKNLNENINNLVYRMKRWSYRPYPVKRIYIPKSDGKLRPIGIPIIEDKIVQMAIKRILQALYEQDFLNCSFGFRPGRSPHKALFALDTMIRKNPVNYIIDADISSFFDTVNHKILIQALNIRIGDKNLIRLIVRFLKSGIMEEGVFNSAEDGTPQGAILSPILANVYLHYALDTWLRNFKKRNLKGYVGMIRYCDDFVICSQGRKETEIILEELKKRLSLFKLTLSEQKTRIIRFGRFGESTAKRNNKRPDTFDFLGFTHYLTESRNGYFKVGRKTEKKRFAKCVKNINNYLKKYRNTLKIKDIWDMLTLKIRGHYLYYGIGGNSSSIQRFYQIVRKLIFKWLNRRSQKKSFSWNSFQIYINAYPLPLPKIYHPYAVI